MAEIKAVISITLTNGEKPSHDFDIGSLPELKTWVAFYGAQLNKLFELRTSHGLVIHNPLTVYNRDHVVSVHVDIIGADEYETLVAEIIPDQMGFSPTQDSER